MDSNNIKRQKISREKFLQISGSVIAGGAILAASGYLLRNRNKQLKNCTSKQLKPECSTCNVNCPLREGVTI